MPGRYEIIDDSSFQQPQKKSVPVAAPAVSEPGDQEVTQVVGPKKRGPKPKTV